MKPALFLLLAACSCRTTAPTPTAPTPLKDAPVASGEQPVAVAPPAAAKVVDSGTFRYVMAGKSIGKEDFEVIETKVGRAIRCTTELDIGQPLKLTGSLELDAAGRPLGGEFDAVSPAGAQHGILSKKGESLLLVSTPGGRELPSRGPVDLFLNNNMLSHWNPVCRLVSPDAEKSLTVFPGTDLLLSKSGTRKVARKKEGAAALSLTVFTADLAKSVRLELACDGEKLVLFRQPLSGLSSTRDGYEDLTTVFEQAERSKPALPEELAELPRSIEVPGVNGDGLASLSCSLLVPKAFTDAATQPKVKGKPQRLPAVVLVTGSGPQDRDEDTVGPGGLKLSIFKVIAIALGKQGIASLRCDDRGVGESKGTFTTATLQSFVRDAAAQVALLRREPLIDPARIGLLGHSEGGVVAPLVAVADPKVKALVLMAGTGRPLDLIILEQQEAGLLRTGTPEEQVKKAVAESREVFDAIKSGKPLPASIDEGNKAVMEKARPWLHSHFIHDPVLVAQKLKSVDVLVAQGARDVQVSVKDSELLRDAFAKAGNKKAVYKLYPGLNHLFAVTITGSLADYSDPAAKVDETFLADLTTFLSAAFK